MTFNITQHIFDKSRFLFVGFFSDTLVRFDHDINLLARLAFFCDRQVGCLQRSTDNITGKRVSLFFQLLQLLGCEGCRRFARQFVHLVEVAFQFIHQFLVDIDFFRNLFHICTLDFWKVFSARTAGFSRYAEDNAAHEFEKFCVVKNRQSNRLDS